MLLLTALRTARVCGTSPQKAGLGHALAGRCPSISGLACGLYICVYHHTYRLFGEMLSLWPITSDAQPPPTDATAAITAADATEHESDAVLCHLAVMLDDMRHGTKSCEKLICQLQCRRLKAMKVQLQCPQIHFCVKAVMFRLQGSC